MPGPLLHHRCSGYALALLAVLTLSLPLAHSATPVQIHRYAEFNSAALSAKQPLDSNAQPGGEVRSTLTLRGKSRILTLHDNTQLIGQFSGVSNSATPQVTLLSGQLDGVPSSWVRLTHTARGTHGLLWDGEELFAIEPSAAIAKILAAELPAPRSDTVMFSLADASVDLGTDYCGSDSQAALAGSGMAVYQALSAGSSNEAAPTLLLELQALADTALRAQYESDQAMHDALLVRLNNVDGLFSAQLGLRIVAADVRTYSQTALSSSSNANTLLNSLGQLRNGDATMRSYAATHLFTGRDLDGDTLGIAYIGNICGPRYGASLSQVHEQAAWLDSLVAAHELAHQLGAVHDGVDACRDTPAQGFLMSAQISGSAQFSACSLASIGNTMQRASCLVPANLITISATADSGGASAAPATGGGSFSLPWLCWLGLLAFAQRRLLRKRS